MAKKRTDRDSAERGQDSYVSLKKEACAELTERKSLFIGSAGPAACESEAVKFIERVRMEHSDATHNVWAYYLRGGAAARCSDDGEPQGTAGMPVLDVIKKSGADNCAVVVTRYFGGILLGAGGLVRAYASSAKLALEAAQITAYESYTEFTLCCGYAAYQKILAELPKYGAVTDSVGYEGDITLCLAVKSSVFDAFCERLYEMFSGSIVPSITGSRFGCE